MKKRNKKRNQISISEKDIKNKLYGASPESVQKETVQESMITEKDIIKKLYPAKISSDIKPAAKSKASLEPKEKTADLFEHIKPMQPGIHEEIEILRKSIQSLEDKLKASIDQKERLKVKLVQKRKLINIRERLADLILNRMPEKFIILLIVFLILGIFIVMKGLKPESGKKVKQVSIVEQVIEPEVENATVEIEKKSIPVIQPATTVNKRYTIQAAEYADEQAAQRFIDTLKTQGYIVNIDTIYRDKNKTKAYFKINVGAYETLNEAKKFNKIFRKKTNINDSFIKELKQ